MLLHLSCFGNCASISLRFSTGNCDNGRSLELTNERTTLQINPDAASDSDRASVAGSLNEGAAATAFVPSSAQQTSKTQAATGDQKKKKKKSDLEKETGTVNDRIFEVMPNYGTVESTLALPPISSGQKFRLATAGVTDYFTYPFIGFLAALDQANDSPKSWGQGWGAYGKRYGASFADNGIGTYMTTAIFPSFAA